LIKENNRVLVLEGFCYSSKENEIMLELEAIIRSVSVKVVKLHKLIKLKFLHEFTMENKGF
jgi:hypothetical protein